MGYFIIVIISAKITNIVIPVSDRRIAPCGQTRRAISTAKIKISPVQIISCGCCDKRRAGFRAAAWPKISSVVTPRQSASLGSSVISGYPSPVSLN